MSRQDSTSSAGSQGRRQSGSERRESGDPVTRQSGSGRRESGDPVKFSITGMDTRIIVNED